MGNFNENITDGKNNQALFICVKIRKYQHAYHPKYFTPLTYIDAI